jgi:FMN-dependent NADH-azoreductase
LTAASGTFAYGEGGPKGLLLGKRATVIVASGGVYTPDTPAAAFNHVDPYLKIILGFIGLTDVRFISAGGVAHMSSGEIDRETFLRPSLELVRAAAADIGHTVDAL